MPSGSNPPAGPEATRCASRPTSRQTDGSGTGGATRAGARRHGSGGIDGRDSLPSKPCFSATRPTCRNRLRRAYYNIIVVIMIPALVSLPGSPWPVLPPGIHPAGLADVSAAFATNVWRRDLYNGLVDACGRLHRAGCPTVYLDGSYVSGKPRPGDFDACWDPNGVDPTKLDSVFLEFANGRAAQKAAFRGEFFPSSMLCADVGKSFVEFFQRDRFTGKQKGIIAIPLTADPLLSRKVQL